MLFEIYDNLTDNDQDYQSIMSRMNIAFKVAKKYERFLIERQVIEINLKLGIEEVKDEKTWPLEDLVIPQKDSRALEFYQNLSEENKQEFENLRRLFFYDFFAHLKLKAEKIYKVKSGCAQDTLPRAMYQFIFKNTADFEALIASRMAEKALKQDNFELNPELISEWRVAALTQLQTEETEAYKEEKLQKKQRKSSKV